jgi:hypothetical protein
MRLPDTAHPDCPPRWDDLRNGPRGVDRERTGGALVHPHLIRSIGQKHA